MICSGSKTPVFVFVLTKSASEMTVIGSYAYITPLLLIPFKIFNKA
jgi:hypothetical protein